MAKRAGVISSSVAVTLLVASSGLAMAKSKKTYARPGVGGVQGRDRPDDSEGPA